VTLEEINHEIEQLEPAEINTRNVQVLSSLYVIRNNLSATFTSNIYRMPAMTGSDFRKAVSGMSVQELMDDLDELMNALQVMYPKLYNNFMQKLW
jgi:hypothetical protein